MKQKNQKNKYGNILRWKNVWGFISQVTERDKYKCVQFFSNADNPFLQDATEE